MTLKEYLQPQNIIISEATDADGVVSLQVKEHSTGEVYVLDEKIYEFFANSPLMVNLKLIVNNLMQKTHPTEDEVIKAFKSLVSLQHKYGKVNPVNQTQTL